MWSRVVMPVMPTLMLRPPSNVRNFRISRKRRSCQCDAVQWNPNVKWWNPQILRVSSPKVFSKKWSKALRISAMVSTVHPQTNEWISMPKIKLSLKKIWKSGKNFCKNVFQRSRSRSVVRVTSWRRRVASNRVFDCPRWTNSPGSTRPQNKRKPNTFYISALPELSALTYALTWLLLIDSHIFWHLPNLFWHLVPNMLASRELGPWGKKTILRKP